MSSAMRNFMEAYHAVHNPDAKEEFYSQRDPISEMNTGNLSDNDLREIAEEVCETLFDQGVTVKEAIAFMTEIFVEGENVGRNKKVDRLYAAFAETFNNITSKAKQLEEFAKHRKSKKLQETWSARHNQEKRVQRHHRAIVAEDRAGVKAGLLKMIEGVRDMDPEKGTKERKERLEKKRGMKMDDHPQYKKESYEKAIKANQKELDKLEKGKEPATAKRYREMKKEEVEQVDEMIDPKGAARIDAAKKKKKVDVFAYDRKLQAQGKLKGKKLPPPPTNEAAQYDEMYKALPKEKMQRQTQKAYDKEQRAVAAGDEKEVNKQMQRRIAMTSPSGRKSALMKKSMKESWADAYKAVYGVDEEAKPDYLDFDKDGNKKESMKKALKDKKKGNPKHGMKGHKCDDECDHDENGNGGDMSEAKDFIQKAIKRPGAFTAKAKERGMSAKEFASKVTANSKDYDERTVKQANLAKTLSGLKKEEQDFDAILQEVQKDGTPIEEALWIIANTTI